MKVKNVMAYKSYVCFVLYSWLQIYTNTNSFIDNQIALTGSINQHKISYNDFNDQKYQQNKINNNKHYGY